MDLIALCVVGVFGFACIFASLVLTLHVAVLQKLAAMDASNELPPGMVLIEAAVEHLQKNDSPAIDLFLSSKKVRWYMKLFGGGGLWLDRISEQEIRNHLISFLIRELEQSHRVVQFTLTFDRNELIEAWHLIEPLTHVNKRRYQTFLLESIENRKIEMLFVQKL